MSADEYFRLDHDGFRYELIDGLVCMSPSPTPRHQRVAARLIALLDSYVKTHPVGYVCVEVDVDFGPDSEGRDIVYRPDIVFVRSETEDGVPPRITTVPALVVEVLSPATRQLDLRTKKDDYQRAGVLEYWLIDPENRSMTFCRLRDGRYVDVSPAGDRFDSEAVPGFKLDLNRVRPTFGPE